MRAACLALAIVGALSAALIGIDLSAPATVSAEMAPAETLPLPGSQTMLGWLVREHQVLRRYLAVVRQAEHDYRYGYATPLALMAVAMDFFTGYVAHIHAMEEEVLYPALRARIDQPAQVQMLKLIEGEQRGESAVVKSWQQHLEELPPTHGQVAPVIVNDIEALHQLINRHLVLQENHLFPLLDLLSMTEQAAMLERMEAFRLEVLGSDGTARYEQLLSGIEAQIDAIAGRIW